MKKVLFICLTLGILISFGAANSSVMAATKVVMIGDSWGWSMPDPLNTHFNNNGHGDWDVLNLSVPGATADAYASDLGGALTLVLNTLAITPSVEVVAICLGGNDFAFGYGGAGSAIFTQIEDDLRYIVDQILAVRPDLDIVFTGYDILKYDKSEFCLLFAFNYFGLVLPWEVTPLFQEILAAQQRIANDYPEASALNLFGTGQGNPGSPNIFQWSPSSYVASEDLDCLHLSSSGYTKFTREIYCQYFAPRFGENCAGPICSVAPGAYAGGAGSGTSARVHGFVILFLVPLATIAAWKRWWVRKREA